MAKIWLEVKMRNEDKFSPDAGKELKYKMIIADDYDKSVLERIGKSFVQKAMEDAKSRWNVTINNVSASSIATMAKDPGDDYRTIVYEEPEEKVAARVELLSTAEATKDYVQVLGLPKAEIDSSSLQVPNWGKKSLSLHDQQIFVSRMEAVYESSKRMLGYPLAYPLHTTFFDFARIPLKAIHLNNLGDPEIISPTLQVNTKKFEQEVLREYSSFLGLKNSWGYITSGGTLGNMQGILCGREMCHKQGILYFSQDAHYSIKKIAFVLNMPSRVVDSTENGEIDYSHLEKLIEQDCGKESKTENIPIVCANIGTTMKGAVDDTLKIRDIFRKYGLKGYIHADMAMFGNILPFTSGHAKYTFDALDIDSVSISFHKFFGTPEPSGIFLTRREVIENMKKTEGLSIEYVGTDDTTIPGSRSGTIPVQIWYLLKLLGYNGLAEMVTYMLAVTQYTKDKFMSAGLNATVNHKFSNIVVIDLPPKALVEKYCLAPQKNIAHIVILPNTTTANIDKFISDYKEQRDTNYVQPQPQPLSLLKSDVNATPPIPQSSSPTTPTSLLSSSSPSSPSSSPARMTSVSSFGSFSIFSMQSPLSEQLRRDAIEDAFRQDMLELQVNLR